MHKPFFSIVIPTYNRGDLIGRCLDSIISQTYTNWEAIIVDNFSEDNTEQVVLSYQDDRIRFIKNHNLQQHRGFYPLKNVYFPKSNEKQLHMKE